MVENPKMVLLRQYQQHTHDYSTLMPLQVQFMQQAEVVG